MLKILVIDDSRSIQAFITAAFSTLPVELKSCHNGQEALNLLREGKDEFDLILLDWEMPVLDGPSTLLALKRLTKSPPVIMMSTRNQPEDIALMLERGAKDYVLKPFVADILIPKIESVLGKGVRDAA